MMYSSREKPSTLRQFTLKVGWRSAAAPTTTAANNPAQPTVPTCAAPPPTKRAAAPVLTLPPSVTPKPKVPQPNWLLSSMITAIIVIAVLAIVPRLYPTPAPSAVATITQGHGDFYRNKHPSHTAATLYQGDTLTTDKDSQVRIALHNATQLILDANTSISLNDQGIYIHNGRAYIDAAAPSTSITVTTPFAEITDIGTQYDVSITPKALHITMREGTTKITSPHGVLYASTSGGLGDAVTLDNTGHTQTQHIAKSDEYWEWTLSTIANFNLYNASAEELLQWASRITGKEVIYASQEIKQQVKLRHFSAGSLNAKDISLGLPVKFSNIGLELDEHRREFIVSDQHGD